MTTPTNEVLAAAKALLADLAEHMHLCFNQVVGRCPTCDAAPIIRAMYDALEAPAAVTPIEAEVRAELERQEAKFGEQNHPDIDPHDIPEVARQQYAFRAQRWKEINAYRAETGCEARYRRRDVPSCTAWDGILLEEVYEALAEDSRTPDGELRLRAELIQVAAVAVQQVKAIDRRRARREAADGGEDQ